MPTSRPSISPTPGSDALRADFGGDLALHYPTVVAQLYVVTLHAAKARELVQDAYAQAWRQWATIRDLPDPTGWVRNVAIHSSRGGMRIPFGRRGARHHADAEGPKAPADVESRALLQALGALDPAQRRYVVLYHVVGLPVDAIGNIEQVAVSALQAQLAWAHRTLVETMAGQSGGAPFDVTAWDERKAVALRNLVAALAGSVLTPVVSTIIRRAGTQHHATLAAALAVLTVGALGGVTLGVQAAGSPGSVPSPGPAQVDSVPSATAPLTPTVSTPTRRPAPKPTPKPRVVRAPVSPPPPPTAPAPSATPPTSAILTTTPVDPNPG